MKTTTLFALLLAGLMLTGCGKKQQHDDIIVRKVEAPKPTAPIRMQDYHQTTDIKWLGKDYQIDIRRTPDDSLRMVKDETGQKYVDNRITLRVLRSDGSVFFNRTFSKAAFESYLNSDYRQSGILEGIVYDHVEGVQLFFAASVSLAGSDDEYIPLVVSVSSLGDVGIRPDTDLDTFGDEEKQED